MELDSPDKLRSQVSFVLVDSNNQTNKILRTYLTPMGFSRERLTLITSQDKGKNAISYFETLMENPETMTHKIPDILFLDWDLDLPGVEIVDRVRSFFKRDTRIGNIPIIMITGVRPRDQIVTAIQAGVSAILIKPMTGEQLEKKLMDISKILLKSASGMAAELETSKEKMDLLEEEEKKMVMEVFSRINCSIGLDIANREAKNLRIVFTKKFGHFLREMSEKTEQMGDRFSNEGKFSKAKGKYYEAVKLHTKNPDTHLKLGKMYMKSTEYRYAVDCLQTSLANFPNNMETLALLGEAQLKLARDTGDKEIYDQAIKTLAIAATKQEEFTERAASLRDLGTAYSAKGETEKAVGCFKLSLELVSNQIGTLMNLSTALKNIGKEEDAKQMLAIASNLSPRSPEELVELGKVWLEKDDSAKALDFFYQALAHEKASKEDIELIETVIKAMLEHGLVWEASPLIDSISKDRPDLYNALGMAFVKPREGKELRNRDFSQALMAYTKALEIDVTGDRYAYLHNRGMAYYKAGKMTEAEKDFRDAYTLHPNPATAKMLNVIGLDPTTIHKPE